MDCSSYRIKATNQLATRKQLYDLNRFQEWANLQPKSPGLHYQRAPASYNLNWKIQPRHDITRTLLICEVWSSSGHVISHCCNESKWGSVFPDRVIESKKQQLCNILQNLQNLCIINIQQHLFLQFMSDHLFQQDPFDLIKYF